MKSPIKLKKKLIENFGNRVSLTKDLEDKDTISINGISNLTHLDLNNLQKILNDYSANYVIRPAYNSMFIEIN